MPITVDMSFPGKKGKSLAFLEKRRGGRKPDTSESREWKRSRALP